MLVVRVGGHLVDELRDLGGREGGEEVLQVDVGRRQHVAAEVHRARHLEAGRRLFKSCCNEMRDGIVSIWTRSRRQWSMVYFEYCSCAISHPESYKDYT